ncbi:MAG: SPOR domain-containing protein [Pacificimonas sp.]
MIWKNTRYALVGAIAAALATSAIANVADGVERWKAGDYKEAVILWLPAAARGDGHALFNLGLAHRQGRGVPKDLARAEDFFKRAAAKGHNPARTYLGIFLARRGETAEAVKLWRTAAAKGDPHARYMLGIRMFNGDGVKKDWPRAYAYMLTARNAGLRQAERALVKMDANLPPKIKAEGEALAERLMSRGRTPVAAVAESAETPALDGDAAPAERAAAIVASLEDQSVARTAVPAPAPPTAASVSSEMADDDPYATVGTPGWRVQVGAFDREATAREGWSGILAAQRELLSAREAVFQPFAGGVRLQVEGFSGRDDARAFCDRLSASGQACFATLVQ